MSNNSHDLFTDEQIVSLITSKNAALDKIAIMNDTLKELEVNCSNVTMSRDNLKEQLKRITKPETNIPPEVMAEMEFFFKGNMAMSLLFRNGLDKEKNVKIEIQVHDNIKKPKKPEWKVGDKVRMRRGIAQPIVTGQIVHIIDGSAWIEWDCIGPATVTKLSDLEADHNE